MKKKVIIIITLVLYSCSSYGRIYKYHPVKDRIVVVYQGQKLALKPAGEKLKGKLADGRVITVNCSKSLSCRQDGKVLHLKQLKYKNNKNFTATYCAGQSCKNVNCRIKEQAQ